MIAYDKLQTIIDSIIAQTDEILNDKYGTLNEEQREDIVSTRTSTERFIKQFNIAKKSNLHQIFQQSHDLRSPFNGIIGYPELLLGSISAPLTERQAAAVRKLRNTAAFLLSQVDNLVTYASIEIGQECSSTKRSIDIMSILQDRNNINLGNKKIEVQPDNSLPAAYGNQHQITQVFTNLVHNAILFSDGGTVNVCAQVRGDFIEVSIKDAGVGISPEHHEDIIAPFWQADTKSKGLGLGLYISKSLIEFQGGTLKVASHPGNGSTFTFTVPVDAESE